MNGLGRPSVRAVVYTRKSSEEGLDQEFNSLDAQYEAFLYEALRKADGTLRFITKRIGLARFVGGNPR